MQDRYVGDIGDFGKYGLLRVLCRPTDGERPLRLGVAWYRVPDESGTADGKHTDYLDPSRANLERFRTCDPELYDALAGYIRSDRRRSVKDVPCLQILRSDTVYFAEALAFGGVPLARRQAIRPEWIDQAVGRMAPADIVFLDPDNGLEVRSTGPHSAKGPKYATYEEVSRFAGTDRTLIVYQHASRNGAVEEQAARRRKALRCRVGARVVWTLRWSAISTRLYFLLPAAHHIGVLRGRCERMLDGPWGQHFSWCGT